MPVQLLNSELPLPEVVERWPCLVPVLGRHGIDYSSNNSDTLKQACEAKGLSVEQLRSELERYSQPGKTRWSIAELTRHIEEMHHKQERLQLQRLCQLIEPLAKGSSSDQISGSARRLLYDLKEQLELHMLKAEHVLFPRFRNVETGRRMSTDVERVAQAMRIEQSHCLLLTEQLALLFNRYEMPANADQSYRNFVVALKAFHDDLILHCQKEHDILIPLVKQAR